MKPRTIAVARTKRDELIDAMETLHHELRDGAKAVFNFMYGTKRRTEITCITAFALLTFSTLADLYLKMNPGSYACGY